MTQFEFLNSISKGLVQTEVFYQVFRYPLGDNSTARLHCHARLEEGRYIFKYYKSVIPEDKQIQVYSRLTAQNIVAELREQTVNVIKTVEKNSRKKLAHVQFVFIIDKNRKIWFSGSTKCQIKLPLQKIRSEPVFDRSPKQHEIDKPSYEWNNTQVSQAVEIKAVETEEGKKDVLVEPSTSMFSIPYVGKSPYSDHSFAAKQHRVFARDMQVQAMQVQ